MAVFVLYDEKWIHNNLRMQRTYQRFGRRRIRITFWAIAVLWIVFGLAVMFGIVS